MSGSCNEWNGVKNLEVLHVSKILKEIIHTHEVSGDVIIGDAVCIVISEVILVCPYCVQHIAYAKMIYASISNLNSLFSVCSCEAKLPYYRCMYASCMASCFVIFTCSFCKIARLLEDGIIKVKQSQQRKFAISGCTQLLYTTKQNMYTYIPVSHCLIKPF